MNWAEARIEAQRVCLGWSSELQTLTEWERMLRDAAPAALPGVVESLRAADSYLRALEVVAVGPVLGGRVEWARAVDVMADAWHALPVELAIAVTREAERRGWVPKGTADNQVRGVSRARKVGR